MTTPWIRSGRSPWVVVDPSPREMRRESARRVIRNPQLRPTLDHAHPPKASRAPKAVIEVSDQSDIPTTRPATSRAATAGEDTAVPRISVAGVTAWISSSGWSSTVADATGLGCLKAAGRRHGPGSHAWPGSSATADARAAIRPATS